MKVTVHAVSGWVAKHISCPGPLLLQHDEDIPANQPEACKWQIVALLPSVFFLILFLLSVFCLYLSLAFFLCTCSIQVQVILDCQIIERDNKCQQVEHESYVPLQFVWQHP